MHDRAHATYEKNGIRYADGLLLDITERKRREEELTFKTALLEAQSEATIDGILVVDLTGQILLANRRLAGMWDIPEEVIRTKDDKKLLEYVLKQIKDPAAFHERVRYLYAHETEKSRDQVEFKDGRIFDRYSAPIQDSRGVLHGRIWYFRDITERERAEAQQAWLASFPTLNPEPVVEVDPEGHISFMNPAAGTTPP